MLLQLEKLLLLLSCYFFVLFCQTFQLSQHTKQVIEQLPPYFYNVSSGNQDIHHPILVNHGLRDKKQIALTFDADMTPLMQQELSKGMVKSWYNPQIIDTLNRTNTQATIFLTGLWIQTYPEITKELAQNKLFELANHSFDHSSFFGTCFGLPFVPQANYTSEITKTQDLLKQVAGVKNNTYFRFPGGCYDDKDLTMLKKLNITAVEWDVISGDSFFKNPKDIIANTLKQTQNGSIIVMHLHGGNLAPATAQALPIIITELKKEGYKFVMVSELLGKKPEPGLAIKTPDLKDSFITPTQAVKLASNQPYFYKELQVAGE